MTIKKIVSSAIKGIMYVPRKIYYNGLRKRLKNTNPTIISSDCFGGLVYHNLGLKFMSPTINLFFSKDDFITFVSNLKGFLDAELKEDLSATEKFPVGTLECDDNKISINFMHYKTFEEAKEKWDERKKRIDYDNIFIIQVIGENLTGEDIEKFSNLPY